MGVIKIADAIEVGFKQSAWYDHTIKIYPFTGKFDHGRMQEAMRKRFGKQMLNKFGGQCHIGTIELVREPQGDERGWIEVEHMFSIGD